MSTEVLPVAPEPQPVPATEPVAPPTKRKRRGWIIALVIVGVLVVLVIVAAVIAEGIAKDYARDYVRTRIVEVLRLPPDAQVDVDLGTGSIILQALAGRVDTVDVEVPEVALGQLSGSLTLRGEGVPLESTAPVEALSIDFSIDADDLAALGGGADVAAPTFAFVDGEVSLTSSFDLFGASIPLGFTMVPSASDGDLVLTPTSISIGDEVFESGVNDGSFLGQIAAAFLQPQTLCIAGSVPQALVLEAAAVSGQELVLTFGGDGAALGGPEFTTMGVCPAA
ncbi:LmeA family phospholipid-binding protein [Pseudolysinimonas sp.]